MVAAADTEELEKNVTGRPAPGVTEWEDEGVCRVMGMVKLIVRHARQLDRSSSSYSSLSHLRHARTVAW